MKDVSDILNTLSIISLLSIVGLAIGLFCIKENSKRYKWIQKWLGILFVTFLSLIFLNGLTATRSDASSINTFTYRTVNNSLINDDFSQKLQKDMNLSDTKVSIGGELNSKPYKLKIKINTKKHISSETMNKNILVILDQLKKQVNIKDFHKISIDVNRDVIGKKVSIPVGRYTFKGSTLNKKDVSKLNNHDLEKIAVEHWTMLKK